MCKGPGARARTHSSAEHGARGGNCGAQSPCGLTLPVIKNMKQVAKLGKSGYFTTKPDSKLLLKFGTAGATASQLD